MNWITRARIDWHLRKRAAGIVEERTASRIADALERIRRSCKEREIADAQRWAKAHEGIDPADL